MDFTFKVLPFGLSTASYVFIKLLRPLVGRWKSFGHISFVYINDGISGAGVMRLRAFGSQDKLVSGLGTNYYYSDDFAGTLPKVEKLKETMWMCSIQIEYV